MEVLAVYPGRFHPFHKGHASSFNQLAKEFGINNTYLALSQKQEMPKSPFSAGDRAKMAMALGIPKENIISVRNTYGADEYIKRFETAGIDPNQTILVFGVSKKDMETDPRFSFQPKKDGNPSYLQPYVKGPQEPMTKHAYVITTDVADFPILGQQMRDASTIRSAYVKGNDQVKMQILTDLYGSKAARLLKPIFDTNLQQITESIITKINLLKQKIQEAKLGEASPNQQMSVYNPDGTTYRQQKMPTYDTDDIYSKGQPVKYDPKIPDINYPEEKLDSYEKKEVYKLINDNIDLLSPREKQIIVLRFFKDKTLAEVARIFNLSRDRILHIEAMAMRKLRKKLTDTLKPYMQDLNENLILGPNDLVDIYVKGKTAKGNSLTAKVGQRIPNKKIPQYISFITQKYGVNPNAIFYGPSKSDQVKEGDVVPFKKPVAKQLTYKDLPPRVLKLANDWFWQDEDSTSLAAVKDPKGFGSGPKNAKKHISAILQTLGWNIDWDDDFDNLVLTNKQGQSVLLPSMDAYDFTGWAEGSNADLKESPESLDEDYLEEK
jgi:RNA polymerase sigma factor (sigma-70 family)